jgi:hypothetical protein
MTDEQRRKRRSHHIVHDYVNLISAGTEIGRLPNPPLNSHVQFSFILQYRKFADFFANKRKRIDRKRKGDIDLLARDFVSSKIHYDLREWRRWEHHMNIHMFHLSSLRTKNSRPWTGYTENPQMLKEFKVAWERFFDALPEPLRAEFKEKIELKIAPGSEFADLDLYRG